MALQYAQLNAAKGALSTVTVGDGSNSVFDNRGTALMIHAKADDLFAIRH